MHQVFGQEAPTNYQSARQDTYHQLKQQEYNIAQLKKQALYDSYQQQMNQQNEMKRQKLTVANQERESLNHQQQQFSQMLQQQQKEKLVVRNMLRDQYNKQNEEQKKQHDVLNQQKIREEQQQLQQVQQTLKTEADLRQNMKNQQREQYFDYINRQQIKQQQQKVEKETEKEIYLRQIQEQAAIQKQKEDNYKKYYQQFSEVQQQQAKQFVPFSGNRDEVINQFVQKQLDNEREKKEQMYYNQQRKKEEALQDYRDGLKNQMQLKRIYQEKEKDQNKSAYGDMQKSTLALQDAMKQEEIRKREEQYKYYQELKQQTQKKEEQKLQYQRAQSDVQIQPIESNPIYASYSHNPLTNPIPGNVQNPYILRQVIGSNGMTPSSSQSHIKPLSNRVNYASLANQNIVTPSNRDNARLNGNQRYNGGFNSSTLQLN